MKDTIRNPRLRLFAALLLLGLSNLANQGGFEVEESVSCEDCEVEPEIRISRHSVVIAPGEVEVVRAFTVDRSLADWELLDSAAARLVRKGLSASLRPPVRQTDLVDIEITLSEDLPEQPIQFRLAAELENVGQAETSFTVKVVQPRLELEDPGPVVLDDALELFVPEIAAPVRVQVVEAQACSNWQVAVPDFFGPDLGSFRVIALDPGPDGLFFTVGLPAVIPGLGTYNSWAEVSASCTRAGSAGDITLKTRVGVQTRISFP